MQKARDVGSLVSLKYRRKVMFTLLALSTVVINIVTAAATAAAAGLVILGNILGF
jgi:hypothetical protein